MPLHRRPNPGCVRKTLLAGALSLAIAVFILAGCGGTSSRHPAGAAAPAVTLRTCSMVGSGGLAAGYRRRALIFGPLALGNLRTYTAHQPLPGARDDRYYAYEVIAIIDAGAKPVLSLPRPEWPTVALLYEPNQFRSDGLYRIQGLDQVVRFTPARRGASTTASANSTADSS